MKYEVYHYRLWKNGTWTRLLVKKGSMKECEEEANKCNEHQIKFHQEKEIDVSFYRVEVNNE